MGIITRFFLFSFLLLFSACGLRSKPEHERKPVKFLFFRKKLNIRNAAIEGRYLLNRKPAQNNVLSDIRNRWKLSFSDEFDSLDLSKWRPGQPWGEVHPLTLHQYYDRNEVRVKNGYLHLGGAYKPRQITHNDSLINIPYAIGLINSDVSFKQKYGYFEIRSKNPAGPATWPAFWLTGASHWPPEIDIFEMYGGKNGKTVHRQVQTVHWGKNNSRSRGHLSRKIPLQHNTDSVFHTYGCLWTPDYIRFYTDERLTGHFRINKAMRKLMDDEMVIIINNCFDAAFLYYLPADFKRNEFVVDWIRVYAWQGNEK